jgi:thiol:disulfide interchange protein
VAGVLLLVVLTALVKTLAADWLNARLVPAEQQLAALQEAGTPAVVFFHSPDCLSCLEVKKTLEVVIPSYKNTIRLIDVDVTKKNGRSMVERLGLMTTPTLLFVSADGEEELFVGEISQAELTGRLDKLSGGTP